MFSEMIRNLIIVILRIVNLIETYQLFRCSQKKYKMSVQMSVSMPMVTAFTQLQIYLWIERELYTNDFTGLLFMSSWWRRRVKTKQLTKRRKNLQCLRMMFCFFYRVLMISFLVYLIFCWNFPIIAIVK